MNQLTALIQHIKEFPLAPGPPVNIKPKPSQRPRELSQPQPQIHPPIITLYSIYSKVNKKIILTTQYLSF